MNPTIDVRQLRILLDTNVLLRLRQPGNPHRLIADAALQRLREYCYEICIVPQVVYEYWSVSTRPSNERDGLGLSIEEAQRDVAELKRLLAFLDDESGIFQRWEQIVVSAQVRGKLTHDARLAAAMQRHNIREVLTFDVSHFGRFDGISVRDPSDVALWQQFTHPEP